MRARIYLLRDLSDELATKADADMAKWGNQEMETLCLAIAEETGELAQAILKARHERGDPERIRAEAVDLGALCLQMMVKFQGMTHIPSDAKAPVHAADCAVGLSARHACSCEPQKGGGR